MEKYLRFLKISNKFFNLDDEITLFHKIGTEAFAIYSYLLYKQKNGSCVEVSIKMIREFLNRDVTKKRKTTDGLNDRRTILKYLMALERNQLITNIGIELNKSTKLNDILIIRVKNDFEGSWSGISEDLFIENVHKLGHIGWSIYCLLFRLHNESFGGQLAGAYGFACPSEEYMAKVLDRHPSTIKNYLPLLKKYGLVDIIPQKGQTYWNASGEEVCKYLPNHYYVRAKADPGNKYYINFYSMQKNVS